MYASFFGLRELPFNNTPDPRFFYSTPEHEEAVASLIYAIKEGKGFVLLTGEVGSGKTLVTRLMLRHFNDAIVFACINNAQATANELLQGVCLEFGVSVEPQIANVEMLRRLQDFLLAKFAENRPVVLLLDEAQGLSRAAFEQVRMIGNLEADDAKLLQIIIIGQPELRQRFGAHDMRQLRQRIFGSFHLPALTRTQTEGYIRHRLGVAGAMHPEQVFDPGAIDAIFEHSEGLPRLINTVCDNALLHAYAAEVRRIEGQFVHHVIKQMMTLAPVTAALPAHPAAAAATPPPAAAQRQTALIASADFQQRREAFLQKVRQDLDRVRTHCLAQVTREADKVRERTVAAAMRSITEQTRRRLEEALAQSVQAEKRLRAAVEGTAQVLGQASVETDHIRSVTERARAALEEAGTIVAHLTSVAAQANAAQTAAQDTSAMLEEGAARACRLTASLCQVFDRLDERMQRLARRPTPTGSPEDLTESARQAVQTYATNKPVAGLQVALADLQSGVEAPPRRSRPPSQAMKTLLTSLNTNNIPQVGTAPPNPAAGPERSPAASSATDGPSSPTRQLAAEVAALTHMLRGTRTTPPS